MGHWNKLASGIFIFLLLVFTYPYFVNEGFSQIGPPVDDCLCGDFDNDGIDDLAVGVPGEDDFGRTDIGAVVILFGVQDQGLLATNSKQIISGAGGYVGANEAGDRFGSAFTN